MGFADFLDNITDLDSLSMFCKDIAEATREFKEEMIDICMNEGVEVIKSTPAALKELSDIARPIVQPTPANVMLSTLTVQKVIKDFQDS